MPVGAESTSQSESRVEDVARWTEVAATSVERFRKLLLLRLFHFAETLCDETRDLAADTGFLDLWQRVRQLPLGRLAPLSRSPLLDWWLTSGQVLLRNGLYSRYPEAHPGRHLTDFSRLLVSFAHLLPDGVEGRIAPLGRTALQLKGGRGVLVRADGGALPGLRWRLEGGELELSTGDGHRIMPTTSGSSYRLLHLPTVEEVTVDDRTPELAAGPLPEPAPPEPEVVQRIGAALEELGEAAGFVRRVVTTATTRPGHERWIAGLVCVPPAEATAPALLRGACLDLVQRQITVYPTPPPLVGSIAGLGEARRLFAGLAADRLAARLGGPPPDPERGETWGRLALRLMESEEGADLLHALGEAPELPSESASETGPPADRDSNSSLDLSPALHRFGLETEVGCTFRKTRRDTAFSVDDWTFVNLLERLPSHRLEEGWPRMEAQLADGFADEEEAVVTAAVAYLTGRNEAGALALLRCLEFDPEVEEYWNLLAFNLRSLGRRQPVEEILLHQNRDPELLAELKAEVRGVG